MPSRWKAEGLLEGTSLVQKKKKTIRNRNFGNVEGEKKLENIGERNFHGKVHYIVLCTEFSHDLRPNFIFDSEKTFRSVFFRNIFNFFSH